MAVRGANSALTHSHSGGERADIEEVFSPVKVKNKTREHPRLPPPAHLGSILLFLPTPPPPPFPSTHPSPPLSRPLQAGWWSVSSGRERRHPDSASILHRPKVSGFLPERGGGRRDISAGCGFLYSSRNWQSLSETPAVSHSPLPPDVCLCAGFIADALPVFKRYLVRILP